ncbi:hypothetical protein BT96DRAFT_675259 [Gymnopus androsaceus JB14]|uniref:Uncharacterized protein n=1 Tax=Gymnopus androsaceus JB14 TaxID=1447944 RepID=A0A6A4HLR7_9AGAR|nr:hypothetical protein BT96DRAFT_675259 [Gymnopus androsaceus JB14]
MRVAGVASRLLRAATIRTHIFGSSRSPVRLGRVEWIGSSPSASSFDVPPPSSPAPSDPPSPSLIFTPSGPLSKRNLLQQRQALEKQQRLELKAMFGRLLDKREGELRSKVKKKEEKTTPETESEIDVPSAVDVDEAELYSFSSSTPTSTPRPTQPFYLTTRIHSLLLRLHTKPKR